MRIIIGADLVPTESNIAYFKSGDVDNLVGNELLNIMNSSDYRVFNLEVPLSDSKAPITKCGPNLCSPLAAINGLKALKVNLVTIANNHIMDQDFQGLSSTIEILRDYGIAYVGAGNTLDEAGQAYVFETGGNVIGVYACTEHECSIAGKRNPGANPFDSLETPDQVCNLKKRCDYVIVLYHGGKEQYRYPSPLLQKRCRKLAEKGADIVICQHSHCVGCMEEYNDCTIIYGQGNFLFDYNNNEFWRTGLLIIVDFYGGKNKISYIPIMKCGETVRLATGNDEKEIISNFMFRSNLINEPEFIEREYARYAQAMKHLYYKTFFGISSNALYRAINVLLGRRLDILLCNVLITKSRLVRWDNNIRCESHREILLQAIMDDITAITK